MRLLILLSISILGCSSPNKPDTMDGSADGGPLPGDAQPDGAQDGSSSGPCKWTVSGAATASGTCTIMATYSQQNMGVAVAMSGGALNFGGSIAGKMTLTSGTFTLADIPEAGATFHQGTTDLWAMCNNNMCSDGQGNTVPNQGTFTMTLTDPGPVTANIYWGNPHGTIQINLPFDPHTTASGLVMATVTF